jgi:hypothetical protein
MTRGDCLASQAVFDWAFRNNLMGEEEYQRLRATVKKTAWLLSRCYGKDPFDTFEMANKVAIRARNRDRGCYAFPCPVCHKFHVGTHNATITYHEKQFKRRRREEALDDA